MTDQTLAMDTIIGTALVLLGILSLYLEWRRAASIKKMILRMFALILGLVALFFLWDSVKEVFDADQTGVIVTDGHDPVQLESLKKKYGSENIFRTDLHPYQWPDQEKYDTIYMLGFGLQDPSMIAQKEFTLLWNLPDYPEGIVEIQWPEYIFLNKPFDLRGRVSGSNVSKILLKMDQQPIDTLSVADGIFSTTQTVRTGGNHLLQLVELDKNNQQAGINSIDIVPRFAKPMNLILLSSFPSAEMRFLKEHLAQDGHSIISRTLVSRNTYAWDFINRDENRNIWSELAQTDMIIMDQSVFQALKSNEYLTLLEAVKDGLGILIRINGENPGSKLRELEMPAVSGNNAETIQIGRESIEVSRYRFISGKLNGLFASEVIEKGKISFSLIKSTYPLLLSGDSSAYRNIWSDIIFMSSRTNETLAFDFPPVYEREKNLRLNFSLYSNGMPDIYVDKNPVPVSQDINIPERWIASYWPDTPGWHEAIAINDHDSLSSFFYVPDAAEWIAARSALRIQNNRYILGANGPVIKKAQPANGISPFFWLSLFLFTFGFLWLEPRL